MIFEKKKFVFFVGVSIIFFAVVFSKSVYAQETPTPTVAPTPDTSKEQGDLQNKINDLQNKIKDVQGQEKTLSSQIAVMDNQVKLTQYRIDATKQQVTAIAGDIETTNQKITTLQESLNKLTKVLMNRIVVTYEVGSIQPFHMLLSSNSPSDFLSRLSYLKIAQEHDKKLIYATEQAKNDYATQRKIFEDKKQKVEVLKTQLEAYTQQLTVQKQGRERLLVETQGSEANYQKLLTQAKVQLAGFASFADSQGGGLLSGQTSCDGWGCYYNQRDSQWGNILINNRNDCNGPCNVERVGCLITSIAMISSHLGHKEILPSDMALSDTSNFSVGTAALNKGTINVKGLNITRTTIAGSLDPSLVQSGPVIVGVYYGPFGTHFVVIKSYENGNYIMNDPYTAGGKDKNFTDYYSLGRVFEVDRVSM